MLIPITNEPRDYSWGSHDLIAALTGRAPSAAPEAEIWYGDHPGSPSLVTGGSARTLDAALRDAGEAPLPFLMKILAAGSSLSIQAHPTKAQAVAGFAREEQAEVPRDAADRLYRDDNHKPEIIVALSEEFRALVGLRPLDATRRLLALLGDGPAVARLRGLLADEDEESALRTALDWALTHATAVDVAEVTAALESAADSAETDAEFAEEVAVLRAAASDFSGDPGLFVALLMNLVVLRRGEALFAPAGVLHAYQSGLGVELMAASDNVLRGGLTPKHVDVPELLRVLDATAEPAPLSPQRQVARGVVEYITPVADFALTRVELTGLAVSLPLRGPAIVLATVGEVTVTAAGDTVLLRPTEAAYVAAADVTLTGTGEAFVAQPGA